MVNLGSSTNIGTLAESDACQFLEKQGLILLEKNYTAFNVDGKKVGEIDLIMRDGKYLVFIEVRNREQQQYGGGIASITRRKQQKIANTALLYLQQKKLTQQYCRFDVISIESLNKIHWIKNAFTVQ